MPQIFTINVDGNLLPFYSPNECPICQSKVILTNFIAFHYRNDDCQIVYLCPNDECQQFFLANYKFSENRKKIELSNFQPTSISITNFSETIKALSSNFVKIYIEAEHARQLGLIQVAGPGFRKAFEFLIKDYAKTCIHDEKEKETIEQTNVTVVLSKYIEDPRITDVAKRAIWVGNDETHYHRKWNDKDITDLKILIDLAIYWIEIEKKSADYINSMPEAKNS